MSAGGVRHLYVHLPFCASRCGYCDFVTLVGRRGEHGRAKMLLEEGLVQLVGRVVTADVDAHGSPLSGSARRVPGRPKVVVSRR